MESGYNEHGYKEIPAIAKSFLGTEFSPVIFNIIKYGYITNLAIVKLRAYNEGKFPPKLIIFPTIMKA